MGKKSKKATKLINFILQTYFAIAYKKKQNKKYNQAIQNLQKKIHLIYGYNI